MARVVVVGGGFGGTASAARLAKLGHEVTLVERCTTLGGALRPVERDGYRWDAAAAYTLLPAVIRDLFRKSGRPAERELELVPRPVVREHRFADGTRLEVPGGSRAAQWRAFDGLGPGLGEQWCAYVAAYTEEWELLRRHYLERPWAPDLAPPEVNKRLFTRRTLLRRIHRGLRDPRLRLVAGFPHEYAGQRLAEVPAWRGVEAYVEQTFGAWRVVGGMSELAEAMTQRLATRRVRVLTGTTARDLVLRAGRLVAVRTDAGELDTDLAVVAVDPCRLPVLAAHVRGSRPVEPPRTTYVGLRGDLPALTAETVLHGGPTEPTVTVRTAGPAWTVQLTGGGPEDPLAVLARRGLDVRDRVVVHLERSPAELVEDWGGSPYGLRWRGRRTVTDRLGPRTPLAGVYAAGAHATPGGGLPFVGLSAALVAQVIGPA